MSSKNLHDLPLTVFPNLPISSALCYLHSSSQSRHKGWDETWKNPLPCTFLSTFSTSKSLFHPLYFYKSRYGVLVSSYFFFLGGSVSLLGHLPFLHRWAPFCGMPLFVQLRAFRTSLTRCTWKRKWMHQRMRLVQPCKVSITRVHHRRLTEAYIGHEKLAHQPVIVLVLQETASLWLELRVMLDIPSQYMHYCLVLLCEVYCVIV